MSTGRIDVIAATDGERIWVSLESLKGPFEGVWNADLTIDEARYLRDELIGAIEKQEETAERIRTF